MHITYTGWKGLGYPVPQFPKTNFLLGLSLSNIIKNLAAVQQKMKVAIVD